MLYGRSKNLPETRKNYTASLEHSEERKTPYGQQVRLPPSKSLILSENQTSCFMLTLLHRREFDSTERIYGQKQLEKRYKNGIYQKFREASWKKKKKKKKASFKRNHQAFWNLEMWSKYCASIFHFSGTLKVAMYFICLKLDIYQLKNTVGSNSVDQILLDIIILRHFEYNQVLKHFYHPISSEQHCSYQLTVYRKFF